MSIYKGIFRNSDKITLSHTRTHTHFLSRDLSSFLLRMSALPSRVVEQTYLTNSNFLEQDFRNFPSHAKLQTGMELKHCRHRSRLIFILCDPQRGQQITTAVRHIFLVCCFAETYPERLWHISLCLYLSH